ncbi:MAG: STAS domain-containing protein [Vicinamibacterales bacterium]
MTVTERASGTVTILDCSGSITLGESADVLKDKVRSLLQQGRKQILINLAGVSYIDSAGLGELVSAYTTATRQGGALKLSNLTKRIEDLLVITKLSTVFELYEDEPAAIASFGASV